MQMHTQFPMGLIAAVLIPLLIAACERQEPVAVELDIERGWARGSHAAIQLATPDGGPFPSDRFTVSDAGQYTGLRVNLPKPDCSARPSDCEDIDALNTLDGFNIQPRLSIAFEGPIDLASVGVHTVFLLQLGDARQHRDRGDRRIGINQIVWDVATNTLHAQADEQLDQHTRYALIVTRGVRDPAGAPLAPAAGFERVLRGVGWGEAADRDLRRYRAELLTALLASRHAGVDEHDVVTASVFTTQSATTVLEKLQAQIASAAPGPADFNLGPGGSRAVYRFSSIASMTFNRQMTTDATLSPSTVANLVPLRLVSAAVDRIAFGRFTAADYMVHPGEYIPPFATQGGEPSVQGSTTLYFNVMLPSGPMPPNGWPVAIVGHGRGNHKNFGIDGGSSVLSARGVAMITINAVGHGFGPLSTLTIEQTDGTSVTVPAGGRGFDQNGDGQIGEFEGSEALAPHALRGNTDAMVQTVADLMQLVRLIKAGMDVDGNGHRDLDGSRITYWGWSLGAMYGLLLHATTPSVQASVFSAIASPILENRRLSPMSRQLVAELLGARTPSLLNGAHGLTSLGGVPLPGPAGVLPNAAAPMFNENLPLRNQPPVVSTIPGAMAIQEWLDRANWVGQAADPAAYAPLLRLRVPPHSAARPFLIQIARADQVTPLAAARRLIHAGALWDRVALYRHDLFWPTAPSVTKSSHGFPVGTLQVPWRPIVVGAQEQIAGFLVSGGTITPNATPGAFWEWPLSSRLPDELDYIP